MLDDLEKIVLGIIPFALVIVIGSMLVLNFGNSVVNCATFGNGDSTWNSTRQLCVNKNGCSGSATYNNTKCAGVKIVNQTIYMNDTPQTPSVLSGYSGVVLTSVVLTNASTSEVIHPNNYTISAGTIVTKTDEYNGTNVNVSASYGFDSSEYTGSGSGTPFTTTTYLNNQLGTSGLASYTPLIVITLIGSMILFYFFGRKSKY